MAAQIELRSRNANTDLTGRHRDQQPHSSLRRMQSRNHFAIAIDNTFSGLRFCFDKFADAMATVMSGILNRQQARSVSIYLTAFLIAILMLAFCRELNMYCFRTVARNDSAAAPRHHDHVMLSNTLKGSTL